MCECKVGPGRLEGEGPLTALVHEWDMNGFGGDSLDFGDGSWASLLFGTFSWATPEKDSLLALGYCERCIADMIADLPNIKAITYGSDSQGFLWSKTWDSAEEAQAAYDEDAATLEEEEEEA